MSKWRPPRTGIACLVAVAAALLVPYTLGHAASLSAGSRTLGGKGAAVAACDTDGFAIIPNLTVGNVVSVTVGGVAAACATGTMSVNVNNGLTNSSGSAAVPAGGGSMTVTLALPVLARDIQQVDVAITGP